MLEVEVTVSGGGHGREFTPARLSGSSRSRCHLGRMIGWGGRDVLPGCLRRAAGGAAVALEALEVPAAEAPDVALALARVDLAARQVHVGARDLAPFVALEPHPLVEHVVGVRQAGSPV